MLNTTGDLKSAVHAFDRYWCGESLANWSRLTGGQDVHTTQVISGGGEGAGWTVDRVVAMARELLWAEDPAWL